MEYQLKFTFVKKLVKFERVFKFDSTYTFKQLHQMIMAITQFKDRHAYKFTFETANKLRPIEVMCNEEELAIAEIRFEIMIKQGEKSLPFFDINNAYVPSYKLASKTQLRELFKTYDKCIYSYDFEDMWEFEITVLQASEAKTLSIPSCLSAVGIAPPEECGGIIGYKRMLDVLSTDDTKNDSELPVIKTFIRSMQWKEDFSLADMNAKITAIFKKKKN